MSISTPASTSSEPAPIAAGAGSGPRFPLFDSLRAIAALSVVAYHATNFAVPPDLLVPYMRQLRVGVTIFFVISGVLIYRPFVRARAAGQPFPGLRSYAGRRFLRIVPAYWLALTVTAAFLGFNDTFGARGILYYGFGQIYDSDATLGGLGVAWTLCIEVTFYLFVPLWAWAMARWAGAAARWHWHRELWALLALVLASAAFKAVWAIGPGVPDNPVSMALPHYLDLFAAGMAMAVLSVHLEGRPLPRWLAPISRFPSIGWIAAGIAFVLLGKAVADRNGFYVVPEGRFWARYYLQAVVATGLVLPCVFGDQSRGVVRRLLAMRWLLWLGVVSYGIYLWHQVVFDTLADLRVRTAYLVLCVIGAAATAAIAAVSYYAVERPALSLKRYDRRALATVPVLPLALRVALGAAGLGMAVIGLRGTGYFTLDAFFAVPGALLLVSMSLRARVAAFRWPVFELSTLTAMSAAVAIAVLVQPTNLPGVLASEMPRQTHVVEVVDQGLVRLYVNGRRVASTAHITSVGAGLGPMTIGSYLGHQRWSGQINEIALYRVPLAAAEVARQFTGSAGQRRLPSPSDVPGLAAAWRLRAAAGSRAQAVPMAPGERSPVDGGVMFTRRTPTVAIARPPDLGTRWTVAVWLRPRARSDRVALAQPGRFYVKTAVLENWEAGTFVDGQPTPTSSTVGAVANPDYYPDLAWRTTRYGLVLALLATGGGVLWVLFTRRRTARAPAPDTA